MPHFDGTFADFSPFGKNEYRRSTVGEKFDSATFAKSTAPTFVIDGSTEKILQSGMVVAKITSGADQGKTGPFQLGATDGRQTPANIVGINDTFTPWQLLRRDKEIAYMYIGTVVQAKCFILDASGVPIALTDTVIDAMRGTKGLDITAR